MPSATRRASGAAFTLRPGESITFALPVTPRTKKNSRRHIKRRSKSTGKTITVPLPSDAYCEMEAQIAQWAHSSLATSAKSLVLDWNLQASRASALHLAQPLNCAAIFYRDALRGDAVGYYQGLADALESAGVLSDDKWIIQWDGSRLAKDAKRPRIEVTLRALTQDELDRVPEPVVSVCPECGRCDGA